MFQLTEQPSNRRAATRERLRTAAADLFHQHGIAVVSIDTLCKAAGFSRGAFYSNYESRYDLALELVSENQEAEIDFWLRALGNSTDFPSTLIALETRFDSVVARTEWGLLNVELQLEAERDERFGARYQRYIDTLNDQSQSMISAICFAAEVPVPANIKDITSAVRAFATGLMLNARLKTASSPGAMIMHFLRSALDLDRRLRQSG